MASVLLLFSFSVHVVSSATSPLLFRHWLWFKCSLPCSFCLVVSSFRWTNVLLLWRFQQANSGLAAAVWWQPRLIFKKLKLGFGVNKSGWKMKLKDKLRWGERSRGDFGGWRNEGSSVWFLIEPVQNINTKTNPEDARWTWFTKTTVIVCLLGSQMICNHQSLWVVCKPHTSIVEGEIFCAVRGIALPLHATVGA